VTEPAFRYAIVTLRRGKRRAVLVGPDARLWDVSSQTKRGELDRVVAGYFADGWKTADIQFLYPHATHNDAVIVHSITASHEG